MVTQNLYVNANQHKSWISLGDSINKAPYSVNIIESTSLIHKVQISIRGCYDYSVNVDGSIYHKLSLGHGYRKTDEGDPMLPVINQLIAIPKGASYKVSIIEQKWQKIEIGKIAPSQKQYLEAEEANWKVNNETYEQDSYPSNLVDISQEKIWRGIRNVSVSICPFKYFPASDQLSILTDFTLEIAFLFDSINSNRHSCVTEDAMLWKTFDNNIFSSPKLTNKSDNTKSTFYSGNDYDYLIIVGDIPSIQNSQALRDFQRWKAFKGYRTKIVPITAIGNGYLCNEIKSYIDQEYKKGVRYVLLIGDYDKIPLVATFSPCRNNILSDYWYGCLDGFNDYEAEVPIGRFSTNSLDEFQNMVNKTIMYESSYNGNTDDFLLISHFQNAPGKYQGCCEDIKNAEYNASACFYTAYGASTNVGGDEATNDDVNDLINSGMHIVNYRGHGSYNLWGNEDGWNITNECYEESQINNINTCSIYFNICCRNGDLFQNPCFMETFTRSSRGAIACIASTMDSYTDANDEYNKFLFSKLLNDSVWNLGNVSLQAHIASMAIPSIENVAKDNAYIYLCGGDPTLEIWTDVPSQFYNVTITSSNNEITISSNDFNSDATISIVSENGYLINKYNVTGNTCIIPMLSDNFYVVVNRHNYYPYTIYFNHSNYIQNETINENSYYDNTPINIGYDVSTLKPNGDVMITSPAKVTIHNESGEVTIKNNFNCEKGATLIIE